ncbi:MAG: DinB family protein [Planctomycetota bacterium]
MKAIELIRGNLERSRNRVLGKIEDMREQSLVFPTPNGGCHTRWLLGHLAHSENQIVQVMMLGKENEIAEWGELFGMKTDPSPDAAYPEFDRVLEAARSVRESTIALVDTLSEEDLDRASVNCPEGREAAFGTYGLCLQFAADHWLMHRGQMADARRAAGIGRAGP